MALYFVNFTHEGFSPNGITLTCDISTAANSYIAVLFFIYPEEEAIIGKAI